MTDIIKALTDTPIPTMLVVAGILFLLLSVADKVSAHLTIPEARKKHALLLGLLLLAGGVGLSLQPGGTLQEGAVSEAPAEAAPDATVVPASAANAGAIDWETMTWEAMKAEQRGHWALLGWSAERWANGPAPASNAKAFRALSAEEQAAVSALGITPVQWDSR